MDLVLLIGLPALLGVGYLIWKIWFNRDVLPQLEAHSRRREDARDWQRRFGADSLLAANFLQPTQNEILETLYLLDHLTPGWEADASDEAERHFLNELASSFPTLRKTTCEFPLPFEESLPAVSARAKGSGASPVREKDIAAQREEFRTARAHANALEQIVSGPAGPTVVTPGSLPFRVSNPEGDRSRGNPWPARMAGTAVLGAVAFGAIHLLPKNAAVQTPSTEQAAAQPAAEATPEDTPDAAEASTADAEKVANEPAVDTPPPAIPASPTAPVPAVAAATPDAMPTLPPPATPDPQKAALNQQIAASQQRAVSKYPSLAVEGSEINLRFVFRYKALIQQNSPRLLDPNWPEKLVEECAADSRSSLKRNALTQILDTHR